MFEFLKNEGSIDDIIIFFSLVIVIGCSVFYIIKHRLSHYTLNYYYPVDLTIEHHIMRIPIEDRVDLAIEDKHNVHNKTLKRSAEHAIEQLKKVDQHQFTVESTIELISQLIELSPDPDLDKLDAALHSLKSIDQIDAYYHSAEIVEKEILRLVWERINHPVNAERNEQLKDNLLEQLADCKNGYSGVHCCEGRVMRLLQTLENCDQEEIITLRPMWAYKEEIGDKIAQYRQKLFEKLPKQYAQLDEKSELTPADHLLLDRFNRCLIKNLNRRFTIDYVSKGLLTNEELADLTQIYYESLYEF